MLEDGRDRCYKTLKDVPSAAAGPHFGLGQIGMGVVGILHTETPYVGVPQRSKNFEYWRHT
jgi:hypothetical protein